VATALLRIGELSRRTGVSPELLRAWERRYGLLEPGRTSGRFRLYSESDVTRVGSMRAHLEAGLSASEAARAALAERLRADSPLLEEGADFVLGLTLEKLPSEVGLVSLFDINKREFIVVRQAGGPRSALCQRQSERSP
jgi:DNA-binding transcriptional MerR regulator